MITEVFIENNLITNNQYRFKPGDSCINQHLSITHDIYKSFNDGFEVKGMFRNITKSFKCNKAFFRFKKTENGIKRAIFILARITAGVPQGSNLGSLFFLIYVNDLSKKLSSNPKLFMCLFIIMYKYLFIISMMFMI